MEKKTMGKMTEKLEDYMEKKAGAGNLVRNLGGAAIGAGVYGTGAYLTGKSDKDMSSGGVAATTAFAALLGAVLGGSSQRLIQSIAKRSGSGLKPNLGDKLDKAISKIKSKGMTSLAKKTNIGKSADSEKMRKALKEMGFDL